MARAKARSLRLSPAVQLWLRPRSRQKPLAWAVAPKARPITRPDQATSSVWLMEDSSLLQRHGATVAWPFASGHRIGTVQAVVPQVSGQVALYEPTAYSVSRARVWSGASGGVSAPAPATSA